MTVSPSILSRPATRLLMVLMLALGLSGGFAVTNAPQADAQVTASTAMRALIYANSKKGTLYLWGGNGPSRFDCSGLTKWAYARAGRAIPRTAQQQYNASIHETASQSRPGDLVFFFSGRSVTHVGLRAARGYVVHAPRTGQRVKLSRIWTTAVRYGRVR
jgi:cell wall-associated NlpC family hydrolase